MVEPRGPFSDLVVERLAHEGVPVRAIVRALNRSFDEVWRVIVDAFDEGRLLFKPATDWPQGEKRESRAPTERKLLASELDGAVMPLMRAYGLTGTEARLLAALLRRGEASKAVLHAALYDAGHAETDPKILDVYACKLRRKITPRGIEIKTHWGKGYSLSGEMRRRILDELEAQARAAGELVAKVEAAA